ncbi:MAG: hypothetical protein M1570_06765 [Chloroflexi bacterium]|nr:hypothetical protein [Chloroflexota bacterium]
MSFTPGDKYRILIGALAILLGVIILARTLPLAISPPAVLIGLAFIGFGVYRLRLGYTRLKEWRGRGQ